MAVAVSAIGSGCATLPSPVERMPSWSREAAARSTLSETASASVASDSAGRSGFRLLTDGGEAVDVRIALIRLARDSIDAQYYLIAGDRSGSQFLHELHTAARRGVRVRLLVDDLHAPAQGTGLAVLDAHENVEVRVFNPLPARHGSVVRRVLFSLHEFGRINRRMHNKLLVADGAFAVTGGRNIADEYFDRGSHANFIDLDVLSAGPVVRELATSFDRYWNCEAAFPLRAFRGKTLPNEKAPPVDYHSEDAIHAISAFESPRGSIGAELASGLVALEPGEVGSLADDPRKVFGEQASLTVSDSHLALLGSAQSRVMVASPYLVPGHSGLQALNVLRSRNVDVSILTNSLATTDEPIIHFGYSRYRQALLQKGVALHELKPGVESLVSQRVLRGGSLGRLHGKFTIVDQEVLFVGSMNMDLRSARLNTEAGLIIRSAALATIATGVLTQHQTQAGYRLQFEGGKLAWLSDTAAGPMRQTVEQRPVTMPPLAMRLLARFLGEGML